MKKVLSALSVAILALASCTDLTPVYEKIDSNSERIDALEKKVDNLQALYNALKNNVTVTSVETTEDGYVINFSDGTSATLKDGEKGAQGEPGAAAATPSFKVDDAGIIYVSLDNGTTWNALGSIKGDKGDKGDQGDAPEFKVEDGVLYIRYSADGEWSSLGNINGQDGNDGASPLFKLDETTGNLYVRYSETDEWTLVGNARGEVWIKTLFLEDGYLTIVLQDNSVYSIYMSVDKISQVTFIPEYSDGKATLEYWSTDNAKAMELSFIVKGDISAVNQFTENVINKPSSPDYLVSIYAVPVLTRSQSIAVNEINIDMANVSRPNAVYYTITIDNPTALTTKTGVTINLCTGDYELMICVANRYIGSNVAVSEAIQINKECLSGTVTYAGVTYKTVKMADGHWWMAENLRYVPEGLTPSNSTTNVTAGVYYPIVYDAANTKAAFSTEEADIIANGYLYQSEVALGLNVGDITTVEQAQALEGCQGICPAGWHIPTADDILGLVGKAVSPLTTNTSAPYYDTVNGSMDLLNEDYFNANAWGAFTVADNTKTSGTLMGYLKSYAGAIASGYVCGSTYAGVTYNTSGDSTSGIKNVQFYGFMPMANNGTFNGAKLSYRIAASVRCVK